MFRMAELLLQKGGDAAESGAGMMDGDDIDVARKQMFEWLRFV